MKYVLPAILLGACTTPPRPAPVLPIAAKEAVIAQPCVRDGAGAHFASASQIGSGTTHGCVDGAEVDVFALVAPADATGGMLYEVDVAASAHLCAKLHDAQRVWRGNAECIAAGARGYFWVAVAPGTTAYVRVERTYQQPTPYVLIVRDKRLRDPDEPADSAKTAVALEQGNIHRALLQRLLNDDASLVDYYKVTMPIAGTLEVVVDPGADDVRPRIDLHGDGTTVIASNAGNLERGLVRLAKSVKPGTYYIQLSEPLSVPFGISGNGPPRPTSHYATPYTIVVNAR